MIVTDLMESWEVWDLSRGAGGGVLWKNQPQETGNKSQGQGVSPKQLLYKHLMMDSIVSPGGLHFEIGSERPFLSETYWWDPQSSFRRGHFGGLYPEAMQSSPKLKNTRVYCNKGGVWASSFRTSNESCPKQIKYTYGFKEALPPMPDDNPTLQPTQTPPGGRW